MSRRRRDLDAERRDLGAAADRLLAGTPLTSTTGKLTATELIAESGLRRDVVYRDHKNLLDDYTARVKAQHATPASMTRLVEENKALKDENTVLKKQLADERETAKTMIKVTGELSLELQQAREELAHVRQVPHIGGHSSAQRNSATTRGFP